MGIEYRLTLAGDIPLEQVASVVAPEGVEESALPGYPRLLSGGLDEELGYTITVSGGSHGYFDAENDDGTQWEWEPDAYVNVVFHMRKNDQPEAAIPNMVSAVSRVLATQMEDAALVLNGNWLLLTRVAGTVRKHRPSWWDNYGIGDMIFE
ncbi:SitI3 family protein [Micromonospora sp. NPDC023814]|uniref:SitI3 family protein n=1 Tax=Micromonospora sp. NPDC023814 TaxID=3154596 RepID=UPI003405E3B8